MKLLRRLVRTLAHGVALALWVVLTGVLALIWLTTTEAGLDFVTRQVVASVPGIDIAKAEGRLLNRFSLQGIRYQSDDLEVAVDGLLVDWDPPALQDGRLHLKTLHIANPRVERRRPPAAGPTPWPTWTLPLALVVDDFSLAGLVYRAAPGMEPIRVERVDVMLTLDREKLRLRRFKVVLPEITAELSGTVGLSGPRALDLETRWEARLPAASAIREASGGGRVTGTPERWRVEQKLSLPLPATLTATVLHPLEDPRWTAQLRVPAFAPARFDRTLPAWPVTIAAHGQGGLREVTGSVDVTAQIPEVGPARAHLRGHYRQNGEVQLKRLELRLPRTGAELTATGRATLGGQPRFELAANWRNLAWPPGAKPQWRSAEGRGTVAGSPSDVRFALDGKLRDRPVTVSGMIERAPGRTVFRNVRAHGAGAELAVDGTLDAGLDFNWTLRLDDLALWLPGGRGRVDTRGRLTGTREAPAADAELFAAGLRFGTIAADRVKLNLKAGIQPDAPFVVDLVAVGVEVAGKRLEAEISGQGTRNRHRLSGRVRVNGFPADGAPDLPAMPEQAEPVSLKRPSCRREPSAVLLRFAADGGLAGAVWSGTLVDLDFSVPTVGDWKLRDGAPFRLGSGEMELGLACWDGAGAEFCLKARSGAGGDWQVAADANRLPLARARPWLPGGMVVAGLLNGRARFTGRGSQLGEGSLDLGATGASFDFAVGGKRRFRFKPEPLSLHVTVDDLGTRLDLVAEHPGTAALQASLRLGGPPAPDRWREASLTGRVRLNLPGLALLEPWAEGIEGLKGSLAGDLEIEGTGGRPVLRLVAAVPDARFDVPRLGIAVRNFSVDLRTLEGRQVQVSGRATSGGGDLRFDGTAVLDPAAGWPLSLAVRGNRFLVSDTPEAKVRVSPELTLDFRDDLLAIRGRVGVPEAELRAPEQAGAIVPSADVVFEGADAPPEGRGVRIDTRVDVVLGERVQVQGYGFTGRLGGRVTLEQSPKGPVLGTGEIRVREGKYAYYGVELEIQDGRLMYAHSPVDNPNLAINVTRNIEGSRVGVKVLGTLKKPEATLYADRPMAQADILAYLVTGKPLGLTSSQEGGVLRNAAVNLGGPAGSFLAREIGNRLGIGNFVDISVRSSLADASYSQGFRVSPVGGAATGAQATSLFLGKYLTPRLYVQYGMGLFQNIYVFRVRYELTENWKIQSETGQFSGGDIFYQWER